MGCSQSLNSQVQVEVDLNPPIFKSPHVKHSIAVRSSLRELCKQVINLHQDNEYINQEVNYKISVKGKNFSINDCISLYELRLATEDKIAITASVTDSKKIELTLKICHLNTKTIVAKFQRSTLVRDLLECQKGFRYVRGDIELELDRTLEDYNICHKNKLSVLVEGVNTEEIQIWKIKKSGLVAEANCMNPDCVAYKQRICLNLGFGEFDLQFELSHDNQRECVCCFSTLSNINKIGFCHCQVSVNEVACCLEKKIRVEDYVDYPLPGDLAGLKVKAERL